MIVLIAVVASVLVVVYWYALVTSRRVLDLNDEILAEMSRSVELLRKSRERASALHRRAQRAESEVARRTRWCWVLFGMWARACAREERWRRDAVNDSYGRTLSERRAEDAENDRDRWRRGYIMVSDAVTRTLAAALHGPTPEGAPGPVWAVETPESLAERAAAEIVRLRDQLRDAAACVDRAEADADYWRHACELEREVSRQTAKAGEP